MHEIEMVRIQAKWVKYEYKQKKDEGDRTACLEELRLQIQLAQAMSNQTSTASVVAPPPATPAPVTPTPAAVGNYQAVINPTTPAPHAPLGNYNETQIEPSSNAANPTYSTFNKDDEDIYEDVPNNYPLSSSPYVYGENVAPQAVHYY
ncbi:hypothetical protein NLJ89_g12305 [Agrocybe chaxingu]|uniref:Uncharacterized protein n=1 Tax=Agrocybe chaxingu TaxID=84603 RepID=A0A9W8JQR4_9AGAR|nr:hypothetical protein NLJ89_g12305 [Agrocybe chaxingu]